LVFFIADYNPWIKRGEVKLHKRVDALVGEEPTARQSGVRETLRENRVFRIQLAPLF